MSNMINEVKDSKIRQINDEIFTFLYMIVYCTFTINLEIEPSFTCTKWNMDEILARI